MPKPARELYGVMLLDRGMAKEALAAFEATLKKEPNRLGAYAGASQAAAKAGDAAKAREYSKKIVSMPAPPTRPGPRSPSLSPRSRSVGDAAIRHTRGHRENAHIRCRSGRVATPAAAQSHEIIAYAGFSANLN